MNPQDEKRRNATIKAMLKVKECLELERIYLSVQQPAPMDELYKVHDALEHIGIALDRLTNNEEENHDEENVRNDAAGADPDGGQTKNWAPDR